MLHLRMLSSNMNTTYSVKDIVNSTVCLKRSMLQLQYPSKNVSQIFYKNWAFDQFSVRTLQKRWKESPLKAANAINISVSLIFVSHFISQPNPFTLLTVDQLHLIFIARLSSSTDKDDLLCL